MSSELPLSGDSEGARPERRESGVGSIGDTGLRTSTDRGECSGEVDAGRHLMINKGLGRTTEMLRRVRLT